MVEESDGHEAEDEVCFIPIPKVLMEHCEEQKDGDNDPRFLHSVLWLPTALRKPFNLSISKKEKTHRIASVGLKKGCFY